MFEKKKSVFLKHYASIPIPKKIENLKIYVVFHSTHFIAFVILQLKISVLQFLGVLGSSDVYPHLAVGAADPRSIVIDVAETQMKRIE